MTDNDLLNKAIDILLHNEISSMDLQYIRKHRDEYLSNIPDEERNLLGVIDTDKDGEINYILFFSKTVQGYWNIRGLWVVPHLRRKNIATALLSQVRKHTKGGKGVTAFIPFNDTRFNLSKLFLKCGYKHRRYIASISSTEFNSNW